jgi:vacuolar-type H+-ATPase subunit B/Vma2
MLAARVARQDHVVLPHAQRPKSGEVVSITLKDGEKRRGQVLEAFGRQAVVQVWSLTLC